MNILAVDATGQSGSVSVMEDGNVLGCIYMDNGLVHSVRLLPALDSLLKLLEFDKKKLDIIGVTVGPGSFTGIRIGVSTANAFSEALGIPVVAVNSLDSLAMGLSCFEGILAATIDAQKEGFYTGFYNASGGQINLIGDYQILSGADIADKLGGLDRNFIIAGDMAKEENSGTGKFGSDIKFACGIKNNISAVWTAVLAEKLFLKGEYTKYAEPFYMRKSHAEAEYDKKHKL